jgi:hypothetical protein
MDHFIRPLRVLSLGAGVQSSTVALMMKHGEIEKADVMIFADTGAEPAAVYRFLAWLVPECGIPFAHVTHGDGLTKALERSCRGEMTAPLPPLFTVNPDGSKGMLRRICTDRFKIAIIKRRARTQMEKGQRCVMVRGISADERQRAKPSELKWIDHEHPLIDREMTRQDCKRWMVSHGYPIPPRSACVFCPYRCNLEWQKMRDLAPDDWEEACRMDELMRSNLKGIKGTCFVHAQRVPLREAKIEDDTANHFPGAEGWGVECEGMCGV